MKLSCSKIIIIIAAWAAASQPPGAPTPSWTGLRYAAKYAAKREIIIIIIIYIFNPW